ncbi:MAG: D-alanyl-D-alanine carboxypeptidase [Desulfobulbaceae bacterium]|nr:D-alanyl-D-alanine carboxypeptidase [Desulfobulbaceae bacterium]HIJ91428.1 peptidase S13 [Deltaproteobacteria bacterium]
MKKWSITAPLLRDKGMLRWLFFCLGLCLAQPALAFAGGGQGLDTVMENGGILLSRNGTIIYERNPTRQFMPASVQKIGTALAAIRILGKDYRFTTRFYYSADHDLYIRGFADPLLVSEEVERIVGALRSHGVSSLRNIHVDDSGCRLESPTDGAGNTLNPYDAQNSCLAVNFNTVNFIKSANGTVQSAEEQTPTLPLMRELAQGARVGSQRVNATAAGNQSLRYAGELFAAIFKKQGVTMRGEILSGPVPEGLKPMYEHASGKSLDEVLTGLLKYSNNFIANQLFLAMGAKQYGWPATWDKGERAMTAFYRNELGLTEKDIVVREGSGLSRENRLTPKGMLAILEAFKPHAGLLPFENNCLRKSGTMTGVYCYAGYFAGERGLDSFVLLLNQPKNTREQVLELLAAMHRKRK